MQTLIAFIRVFREYITVTVLAGLSIVLIANSDSVPVQVLRSYSLFTLASLQSSSNWVATLFSSNQDAETLRDVNVSLMEEVMQLRRLRQENMELRRKIGFRDRSNWPLVPSEIVGKNLALGQNMITLDVGEDDSVAINMPVINEEGLVGKIIATSGSFSIAMLALHRDFRATAKIKRSRIDGIIAWREGENLVLQNVWKTADVIPGDTVVTSEYSNIFPPEIMIGIIRTIGPGQGGLFSRIDVEPRVNFASLERVFVVRYHREPVRAELEQRAYGTSEDAP
ncbi:MAG: rod shape-determining protein MreC [Bacteroidetes bacterium]|nr:rod shape-determining protein MreC [Bacteroidota bacterium]